MNEEDLDKEFDQIMAEIDRNFDFLEAHEPDKKERKRLKYAVMDLSAKKLEWHLKRRREQVAKAAR